jgi:hypothetical protein
VSTGLLEVKTSLLPASHLRYQGFYPNPCLTSVFSLWHILTPPCPEGPLSPRETDAALSRALFFFNPPRPVVWRSQMPKASLELVTGQRFEGYSFGAKASAAGEVRPFSLLAREYPCGLCWPRPAPRPCSGWCGVGMVAVQFSSRLYLK